MPTSVKSAQNAFIFIPYRNAAKFSENLEMLWCIRLSSSRFWLSICRESDSSANPPSSPFSGKASSASRICETELARDREECRRGVVGRERGPREEERGRRWDEGWGASGVDIVLVERVARGGKECGCWFSVVLMEVC